MNDTPPFVLRWVDWVLARFKLIYNQEEVAYAVARSDDSAPELKSVFKDMDAIDSKSSALLTHVSVMLAIVVFLKSESELITLFLNIEAGLYTLVALFLMRCIDIAGPPIRKINGKIHNQYLVEIQIRRAVYQLAVRAVVWLTAFLLLIFLYKNCF